MSVSVLISDVIAKAGSRLHLPSFGVAGEFVTDADALAYVQSAVSRLGAMLNRLPGDNYLARTATLATQAGLELVSLPTNCTDVLSVHWVDGNQQHTLKRAPITDYDPVPRAWSWSYMPRYRVEGEVLVFVPIPNAVYSLRVAYTLALSVSAVTDTIQVPPGCEEWLIMDICEIVRGEREQKDPSVFVLRKQDIEANLVQQASVRDRHGVTQVRDARGALRGRDDHSEWRRRIFWGST